MRQRPPLIITLRGRPFSPQQQRHYEHPSRPHIRSCVLSVTVFVLVSCGLALLCLSPAWQQQEQEYVHNQQQHRQLFSLSARQCSLSDTVLQFRYNATAQSFTIIPRDHNKDSSDDDDDDETPSNNETAVATTTADEAAADASSNITTNNADPPPQRNLMNTGAGGFPDDNGELGDNMDDAAGNSSSASFATTAQHGEIYDMRSCWCAAVYYHRPAEYCPANLDTCLVQGSVGPVHCYNTSSADSFVRSFWPVLLFWLIALIYATACSEPGAAAQEYVYRRCLALPCCAARRRRRRRRQQQQQQHQHASNSDDDDGGSGLADIAENENENESQQPPPDDDDDDANPADALLAHQVDDLLQHQPERAAFLYRQAILRARQRQRQEYHRALRQQNGRTGVCRYLCWFWPHSNATSNNGVNVQHEEDAVRYDRLMLKTRLFVEQQQQQPEASQSGGGAADGATASPPASPSPPRQHLSPTNSWRRGRDHTTMDEMDDEIQTQGVRCAICLVRLQTGNVVGDIPCGHAFHKDCLKDWLKRKNRCPLCQEPGLARLQSIHNNNNSPQRASRSNSTNNSSLNNDPFVNALWQQEERRQSLGAPQESSSSDDDNSSSSANNDGRSPV